MHKEDNPVDTKKEMLSKLKSAMAKEIQYDKDGAFKGKNIYYEILHLLLFFVNHTTIIN